MILAAGCEARGEFFCMTRIFFYYIYKKLFLYKNIGFTALAVLFSRFFAFLAFVRYCKFT